MGLALHPLPLPIWRPGEHPDSSRARKSGATSRLPHSHSVIWGWVRPPWATSGQTLGVQSQLGHHALGREPRPGMGAWEGASGCVRGRVSTSGRVLRKRKLTTTRCLHPPGVGQGRPGTAGSWAVEATASALEGPSPWEEQGQKITRTALWRQRLGYLRGHGRVGLGRGA